VGKTNIMTRFAKNSFVDIPETTAKEEYISKTLTIPEWKGEICVQIWDTAGQDTMGALPKNYFRGARAAFVIFDMTNAASYASTEARIKEIKENEPECIITLLANKKDLIQERVVQKVKSAALAFQYKVKYAEVSAKTGENIEQAFMDVIKGDQNLTD
jgi:small GTP-binding protein